MSAVFRALAYVLCLILDVLMIPAALVCGRFARLEDPEFLAHFRVGFRRCEKKHAFGGACHG